MSVRENQVDTVIVSASTEEELQHKIAETVKLLQGHHVNYSVTFEGGQHVARISASKKQLLME